MRTVLARPLPFGTPPPFGTPIAPGCSYPYLLSFASWASILFAISRQEQNGRVIRFAERLAGEGLVCVPEGGVTVVECAISTRVDGDVLKVFWSYCSEVGFIKVPCDNKSCIWVRGFLLTYIPVQFPECLVYVLAWGGI